MIEVIDAGFASTVQDAGRAGWAHLGVPRSGFVDPGLATLVNRLVGNDERAALIETCGNLVLRAVAPLTYASSVEGAPRSVPAGETWHVPAAVGTVWQYVAIRGGVAVPSTLGSRATDTLSGLGPPPLRAGDLLPIGPEPAAPVTPEHVPQRPRLAPARVTPGPRADWFEDGALRALTATAWRLATTSRVGVRLTGASLRRVITDELPSEGLVRGAIQVPPDGAPIMLLADHPTTGGYPVIAVVHPDDVAIVAQTAHGDTIRFIM